MINNLSTQPYETPYFPNKKGVLVSGFRGGRGLEGRHPINTFLAQVAQPLQMRLPANYVTSGIIYVGGKYVILVEDYNRSVVVFPMDGELPDGFGDMLLRHITPRAGARPN